jgi:hypothetical protein
VRSDSGFSQKYGFVAFGIGTRLCCGSWLGANASPSAQTISRIGVLVFFCKEFIASKPVPMAEGPRQQSTLTAVIRYVVGWRFLLAAVLGMIGVWAP